MSTCFVIDMMWLCVVLWLKCVYLDERAKNRTFLYVFYLNRRKLNKSHYYEAQHFSWNENERSYEIAFLSNKWLLRSEMCMWSKFFFVRSVLSEAIFCLKKITSRKDPHAQSTTAQRLMPIAMLRTQFSIDFVILTRRFFFLLSSQFAMGPLVV